MTRMMTIVMTALAVAILCMWGATLAAAQSNSDPQLDGVWVLNRELSDNPDGPEMRDRSDDEQGRGPGGGGGFRGPGGIGGGWGGFGGRSGGLGGREGRDRPSREEMAAQREALQTAVRDLTSAPFRMTIVTPDDEVLLTYGDGRVLRLIADDREHAGIAGTELKVKRRTRWEGELLLTRIELRSRIKLTVRQTYELGLDGEQLVVTSRFDGNRIEDDDKREYRRVYDRVSG